MNDQRTEAAVCDTNLAVLVNAVELGSQVVEAVAGNAIANTIGGQRLSSAYLKEAVAARIQSALTPSTGDR